MPILARRTHATGRPDHGQRHRHRHGADSSVAPLTTGPGCTVAAFSSGLRPLPHSHRKTALSLRTTPLRVWGLLWRICLKMLQNVSSLTAAKSARSLHQRENPCSQVDSQSPVLAGNATAPTTGRAIGTGREPRAKRPPATTESIRPVVSGRPGVCASRVSSATPSMEFTGPDQQFKLGALSPGRRVSM